MSDRLVSLARHLLTAALAVFIVTAVVTAPPREVDRAEAIGSLIRCPVCQGEAIADSPSSLAEDMMSLVRVRIEEGLSDQQIIDELLASYSGAQLLDPSFGPRTAALWAIPTVVALLGLAGVAGRVRRAPPEVEVPSPMAEEPQ